MPTLSQVPRCCTSIEDVSTLLHLVHSCHLCSGNSDEKFIAYISTKNGKIMNASGKYRLQWKKYDAKIPLSYYENPTGTECVAYWDTLHSTIRHTECEILITPEENGDHCCSRCKAYINAI